MTEIPGAIPQESPSGTRKKGRKLLYGLVILLILAAAAVTGAGICLSRLSSRLYSKPEDLSARAMSADDFFLVQRAWVKLSNTVMDEDGNMKREADLYFSGQEVNAVLHTVSKFIRIKESWGSGTMLLHWKDNGISGETSLRLNARKNKRENEQGVRITFRAIPEIAGGKMSVKVVSLKAGEVVLPRFITEKLEKELQKIIQDHPVCKSAGSMVKTARVLPDGQVHVHLDIAALMKNGTGIRSFFRKRR